MSAKLSFFLEFLSFIAILLPLCSLLWIAAKAAASKKGILSLIFAGAAVIALVFILPPHEDIFTGIDNSAYRLMAESFTEGRPIVGHDTSAEIVPKYLRLYLRYRPLSHLRATRDIVFHVGQKPEDTFTRPFFMPLLPMAAAGSGITSRFPILLGAFWTVLLFLSLKAKLKFPAALAVSLALIFATPFPLWFCRGYFADAAAAFIACAPLLTGEHKSTGNFIISGFLLGLSVSIHPISILITAPIYIYLILSDHHIKNGVALTLSTVAGIIPLVLITKYICQPYGDWSRFANIRAIFSATGEHKALASGALLLVFIAVMAGFAAYNMKIRLALSRLASKIPGTLWTLAAILPAAMSCFIPGELGISARKGFLSLANGFGISGFFALILVFLFVYRANAKSSLKMLLTLLCWTAISFAMIKGIETRAGIWNFRRLAPTAIAIMSVGALGFNYEYFMRLLHLPSKTSAEDTHCKFFQDCNSKPWILAVLTVTTLIFIFNLVRSPRSYFGINDSGASCFREELKSGFSDADLVFFDFHSHSTPFACKLDKPVFGLGNFATARWNWVEKWLASTASTGKTVIATSYAPCMLEDGLVLKPHNGHSAFTANFTTPKSAEFIPAVNTSRKFTISLLDAVPLSAISVTNLVQYKLLDGGPIGIRGNWYEPSRKEGRWSSDNSGIIGPVHPGKIKMTIDAQWFPPSKDWGTQSITVKPPWAGGVSQSITLNENRQTITVFFDGPKKSGTGKYTFSAPKKFSAPFKIGDKKVLVKDLGAVFYSIMIE